MTRSGCDQGRGTGSGREGAGEDLPGRRLRGRAGEDVDLLAEQGSATSGHAGGTATTGRARTRWTRRTTRSRSRSRTPAGRMSSLVRARRRAIATQGAIPATHPNVNGSHPPPPGSLKRSWSQPKAWRRAALTRLRPRLGPFPAGSGRVTLTTSSVLPVTSGRSLGLDIRTIVREYWIAKRGVPRIRRHRQFGRQCPVRCVGRRRRWGRPPTARGSGHRR